MIKEFWEVQIQGKIHPMGAALALFMVINLCFSCMLYFGLFLILNCVTFWKTSYVSSIRPFNKIKFGIPGVGPTFMF